MTNLKRQETKILGDRHPSKEPALVTENGKPSSYPLDVEDHEIPQELNGILEGIARGETAYKEERIYSQFDAKDKMNWIAGTLPIYSDQE